MDIIAETALRFFGKMSASISHEVKNALAVMNENAGLLEDFTFMAEKGMPIDPERVKLLAEKIMQQIQRADGIIKNMNRFAHSADEAVKSVDVGDMSAFVATLYGRIASGKGVTVRATLPAQRIIITTAPFLLENLIGLCLDFALNAVGTGKTLDIITEEAENMVRIRFVRLENLSRAATDIFPSEREQSLMKALKAGITVDSDALILSLHKNIGGHEMPALQFKEISHV